MHTLGFYHEHQRPDRDQHVKVNWNEISQNLESQFLAMDQRFLNATASFLTEYDLRSIMHYDSYGNGHFNKPAIVKLDGSIIKPNTKMSDLDIVTLNGMYPCDNSCHQTNVQGKTNRNLKW